MLNILKYYNLKYVMRKIKIKILLKKHHAF